MCKELEQALKEGDDAARKLAEHLIVMNAAEFEKTVCIGDAIVRIKATTIAKA